MARKKTNGGTESPAEIVARLIQEKLSEGEGIYGKALKAEWVVASVDDPKIFPHALKELGKAVISVIKESRLDPDREDSLPTYLSAMAYELAMQPTRYWKEKPPMSMQWTDVEQEGESYTAMASVRVEPVRAGRWYLWIDEGTKPHMIRPKRARALRIRGYAPKTRPPDVTVEGKPYLYQRGEEEFVGPLPWTARKYRRRKAELGSEWKPYYISQKLLPRGYKGKYYSPEDIDAMPKARRAKVSKFVAYVKSNSIAPRYFKEQIAEVMAARVENEIKRLAKDIPEIFSEYAGKLVQCKVSIFVPGKRRW